MRKSSRLPVRCRALTVALLALSGACVESTTGAALGGPTTPRDLLGKIVSAEEEERYADAVDLILPRQRALAVYITWYGVAYDSIGADPAVQEEYAEILARHGLDEEHLNGSSVTPDPDRPQRLAEEAFRGMELGPIFHDLTAFRVRYGRFPYAFGFLEAPPEMTVEGDEAYVAVGDSDFVFERSEGVWFWRFFKEK